MPFLIAHSPEEWRELFSGGTSLPRTAAAIGNFDGVHLGHQAILQGVLERARAQGALAAVITFDPHPLRVLRPHDAPPMLMTLAQRLCCFAELGLDAALVLKFDAAFSHLSPEEFVRQILVETLSVRAVLLGENFRFGYRHAGDVRFLTELGRTGDRGSTFDVAVVPPVFFRGAVVSSTLVREALRQGAVSRVARLLGRPYELEGTVQRGHGIGRSLVMPTLNLATEAEILPAHGVYATETCVGSRADGKWYRSVTNIGIRPTVTSGGHGARNVAPADAKAGADGGNVASSGNVAAGARPVSVESYLFDFDAEVTKGPLAVRFCIRLRDERKFPGLDKLRAQILRDAARAQRFFRRLDSRHTAQEERTPSEPR
jgi:riboflavin kinase/FMN adenylyltransferase